MSTLETDLIQASTGVNTAIKIKGKGSGVVKIGDGELSFPDADGSANQIIKTDGSGTLSFTSDLGKILQIVSATASSTSTTSGSFVDTGLSAAITPAATSSKILVIANHGCCGIDAAENNAGAFKLLRDSTTVWDGTAGWWAHPTITYLYGQGPVINYVDSPSSTSALTYKTQYHTNSSANFVLGYGTSDLHIQLLEIGA